MAKATQPIFFSGWNFHYHNLVEKNKDGKAETIHPHSLILGCCSFKQKTRKTAVSQKKNTGDSWMYPYQRTGDSGYLWVKKIPKNPFWSNTINSISTLLGVHSIVPCPWFNLCWGRFRCSLIQSSWLRVKIKQIVEKTPSRVAFLQPKYKYGTCWK